MSGAPKRIEILVIGDELLDGRVTDTNSVRFAQALTENGLALSRRTTIPDGINLIVEEARAIVARGTELCLVSGGLGPTRDDLTAEAFARFASVEMVCDDAHLKVLEAWSKKRGRAMNDSQRQQAFRPQGSELLPNSEGTAPGFAITVEGCRFVAVPGVPREFDAMVEQSVVAALRKSQGTMERRVLSTFGLIEAEVDARLQLLREHEAVGLGFRVKFPEIHVLLRAESKNLAQLDEATQIVRQKLGAHVLSERGEGMAAVLLDQLRSRDARLAVAESCTGGLIGDLLTDVPGSSETFTLGVVAYSYEMKEALLSVSPETLQREGAVSEAVVLEMATNIRRRAGTTFALAVSGIAGPGGATADKPVGTIWIAAVGEDLSETRKLSLPFERRGNKLVSAYSAVDLLRRNLPALD